MGNYDFRLDLPVGQAGEEALRSLLNGKWEVKRDQKVALTGNVAVEFSDKGRQSGLAQSPADWWGIWLDGPGYDMEVCVLVRADRLRRMVADEIPTVGGDNGQAEMVLLPVVRLVQKVIGRERRDTR